MTEEEFKAVIIKALAWMEEVEARIPREYSGDRGACDEILDMRQVVSMMTGEPMKVDEPPAPAEPVPEVVWPNRDEEIAKIISETDPAKVGGLMALIVELGNLRGRSTPLFSQDRLDYLEDLIKTARNQEAMG